MSDYEGGPYDVPIPIGVTTFNYNFAILDDDIPEITEELTLVIASSSHHQITINQAADTTRVCIVDDEEGE